MRGGGPLGCSRAVSGTTRRVRAGRFSRARSRISAAGSENGPISIHTEEITRNRLARCREAEVIGSQVMWRHRY